MKHRILEACVRMKLSKCNGICMTGYDVGVPYPGIAYAHPECDLHGYPDQELHHENCGCDDCWERLLDETPWDYEGEEL